MNWFSLFAVLLVVTQAPVPVPRQTPNGPAYSRGQANGQSKSHDAPAAPLMAVVQPVTTPEGQDANGDHTKDNATHTVIVRELPTVTIARGGFDWATLANYLLVVVGFGGIGVALWTLCFIRKQVIEMGLQRGVMQRTLTAIKEQADSLKRQNDMIISKERARLRVDLIDLPKEPDDFPALAIIAVVTISGSTEAAVRKTAFQSTREPTDIEANFPPTMRVMRGVPSVIRALDSPTQVRDFVTPIGGFDDIFSGASLVYAKGAIHYTDIFNGKWVYRFYRRYKFLFYEEGRVLGGGWENYGNETDNGEYPDD
jgi:hypothetical protein